MCWLLDSVKILPSFRWLFIASFSSAVDVFITEYVYNNNNNNNKQTFQNAKLTLKSRTSARGGYNQKHANHQTKKYSATVWSAAVRCLDLAAQKGENSRMTGRTMKMPVALEWQSVSAERTASYRRQIVCLLYTSPSPRD